MESVIRFNYADKKLRLTPKTHLKQLVHEVFSKEKTKYSRLNFIFCSDDFLLQINKDFLQHDYYTDIITFPLSEKGMPVEAELYISLDRVRQNASIAGESFELELVRVLAHGALHLCGFNDKTKSEIKEMRKKESTYIDIYKTFHVKQTN